MQVFSHNIYINRYYSRQKVCKKKEYTNVTYVQF